MTLALELSMTYGDDSWKADVLVSWHQFEKYISSEKNKDCDPIKWDILQREFLFNLVKACLDQHFVYYDNAKQLLRC